MAILGALVLPSLLSAVLVFIVSSLVHTVLPWHKNDYRSVPNEDKALDAIRSLSIPRGDYLMPRPSNSAEMRSPEFADKIKKGPIVIFTVMQSPPVSMARNLVLWFLYSVLVSAIAGHVAQGALPPGADYIRIFHTVALSAFLGYAGALWQLSIWYQRAWGTTIRSTVDGLVYALLTAGVFGWLWR